MRKISIMRAIFGGAFAVGMLFSNLAQAAVDFSGDRIEILVPFEPGGGADLYARFLAPLLSEKLPGKPTVIVTNVPGAGAIAGANQFQKRAKPDGKLLIAIGSSLTSNYVFRDERVRFKLDEWIPIISSPNGAIVYARPDLGVSGSKDIAALKGKRLIMGATNASGGDLRILLSLDGLGLDVQPVFGLTRGDARPSFERGEFNINFDTSPAYQVQVLPLVQAGQAVPLFTLGIADENGNIVRDPVVPDVPTYVEVFEALKGEKPSGPAFTAWSAVFNLNVMASKALALPAGTPPEILDAYNRAMKEVAAEFGSPKLKDQAADIVGPYPQALGPAAGKALKGALAFDDESFGWLKNWLATKYSGK